MSRLGRLFRKGRTIEDLFDEFASSNKRNAWLSFPEGTSAPDIKVYVRKSMRPDYSMDDPTSKPLNVIDVANVDSRKPGMFKTFMLHVEKRVLDDKLADAVVVENVYNPRLIEILRKNNYELHASPFERIAIDRLGATPTFIKKAR